MKTNGGLPVLTRKGESPSSLASSFENQTYQYKKDRAGAETGKPGSKSQ